MSDILDEALEPRDTYATETLTSGELRTNTVIDAATVLDAVNGPVDLVLVAVPAGRGVTAQWFIGRALSGEYDLKPRRVVTS